MNAAASLQRVITRLAIKEPPENRASGIGKGVYDFCLLFAGPFRAISPGDRRPIVARDHARLEDFLSFRDRVSLRFDISFEISPLDIIEFDVYLYTYV